MRRLRHPFLPSTSAPAVPRTQLHQRAAFALVLLVWSCYPVIAGAQERDSGASETDKPTGTRSGSPEKKTDAAKPQASKPAKATSGTKLVSKLPWKLDRTVKYSWFTDRAKTGSILVTYKKVDDPSGAFFRQVVHRRNSHEGRGFRTSAEFDFGPDLMPIRYSEDGSVKSVGGTARQDWRVSFYEPKDKAAKGLGAKVKSVCISNGRTDRATTVERDLKPKTYLFASGALEQWAVFALHIDREKPSTISVFYPLFGREVDLKFTPEKAEELEIGEKIITTVRIKFVYPEFKDEGTIWIDEKARLLKYKSGPVTMVADDV